MIQEFASGTTSLEEAKALILRHARTLNLTYLASQRFLHLKS